MVDRGLAEMPFDADWQHNPTLTDIETHHGRKKLVAQLPIVHWYRDNEVSLPLCPYEKTRIATERRSAAKISCRFGALMRSSKVAEDTASCTGKCCKRPGQNCSGKTLREASTAQYIVEV